MDITLREANGDDLDRIGALWRGLRDWHETLQPHRPFRPDAWEYRRRDFLRALGDPDSNHVILAESGDEAVGVLWCEIRPRPANRRIQPDRYAEVETLTVRADMRCQGVGSLLMDACHEWLRAHGIRRIVLMAVAENEGAIAFYRRHGYRPVTVVMERCE